MQDTNSRRPNAKDLGLRLGFGYAWRDYGIQKLGLCD